MLADHYGLAQLMNQAISSYSGAVVVAADQARIVPLLVEHPEGLSAAQVAEALALNPRVTAEILPALHQLGLLEAADGRYQATELAARHLDPNKPAYFGRWANLTHGLCWDRIGQLGSYLTGTLPLPGTMYERGNDIAEVLLAAFRPLGTAVAEAFVERVDLSSCRRLLDVGAGSGSFTIAVLNAVPQARATVTDLPDMIDLTRSYLDKAGLTDRVEAAAADLFTDELPAGFDTIFVNNVFQSWDTGRRATGLARCYRSLEPGGTLYICEHMLDDSVGQVVPSVLGLQILLLSGMGGVYRTDDFARALEWAGFTDVTVTPFPDQPTCSHILSGRKPLAAGSPGQGDDRS